MTTKFDALTSLQKTTLVTLKNAASGNAAMAEAAFIAGNGAYARLYADIASRNYGELADLERSYGITPKDWPTLAETIALFGE